MVRQPWPFGNGLSPASRIEARSPQFRKDFAERWFPGRPSAASPGRRGADVAGIRQNRAFPFSPALQYG
jgi:hypothetical protein